MNARLTLLLAFVILVFAGTALATVPPAVVTAADNYANELSQIERASKRQSLERLFGLATDISTLLSRSDRSGITPLENLSESELATLGERLQGLRLTVGETVGATIDPEFFERLGERKGRTEDRLFLRLYHRAFPNGAWPAYVEQQTDVSGCTDFGNGTLVSLFSEWNRYAGRHPKQYATFVESRMDAIRDVLREDTCACGSSGSVQSELRFFLRRFPNDEAAPVVRKRLDEVRRGTSSFRFNCVAG